MIDEVLRAAEDLVAAFSDGRLEDYFDAFAPDATFIFHNTPARIDSVDEYRRIWSTWVDEDDFQVLSCTSSDRRVRLCGDTAVFTHHVETEISTNRGTDKLNEQETIVFQRDQEGRWLAVHEHLSPTLTATTDVG